MKKKLRLISALLVCCMFVNLLPAEWMGKDIRRFLAQAEAERVVETAGFDELLPLAAEIAENGGAKTSGEWEYAAFALQSYAVVTGYTGTAASVSVPDQLDGLDVVGIARGAFAGHRLTDVFIPGNVLAMDAGALPAGAAVKACHGAYAQTWARKNGHGFENASRYDFRSGVIDLSGIRPGNFNRVSAGEVRLRELEAKRLAVGKRFFLLDENNPYQISYYQVTAMSAPENGFVTLTCETPEVEAVFKSISAVNEDLYPDLSTLQLEEGASLDYSGRPRGLKGSSSFSLPIKINAVEVPLSEHLKFNIAGKFEASWKASYDLPLFGGKEIKIVETDSGSITAGISYKNSERSHTDTGWSSKELGHKLYTKNLHSLMKQEVLSKESAKAASIRQKFCSVMLFSFGGIVNVMMDLHFQLEVSGKAEVSYSFSGTVTYTYKNGELTKKSSGWKSEKSFTLEAEVKLGIVASLSIYVLCVQLFSAEAFVGLSFKASYKLTAMLTSGSQDAGWGARQINYNMADCINVSISFVIDVGLKIGTGKVTFEPKINILTIPLGETHLHVWPYYYTYDSDTDEWTSSGEKDNLHPADECPYDVKTVYFVIPDYPRNHTDTVIDYVDNIMIGETVNLPAGLPGRIRDSYHRKFFGWYTDPSFADEDLVTFPARIKRDTAGTPHDPATLFEKTTVYAKTYPYRQVLLIGANGKQLTGDTGTSSTPISKVTQLDVGGDLVTLDEADNRMAYGEKLILPDTCVGKNGSTPIRAWYQVISESNRTPFGSQMNPGEEFTISNYKETGKIVLMALTDQDIAGHFYHNINDLSKETTVYCAVDGALAAPEMDLDSAAYRFVGWTVTDEQGTVLGEIVKGGSFSVKDRTGRNFYFAPKMEERQDYTAPFVSDSRIGNLPALPRSGSASEEYLTFSGGTVTGIKAGVAPTMLTIPSQLENGIVVTAIAPEAFKDVTSLTRVTLPYTIKSIGSGAFSGCTELRYIYMDAADVTAIPSDFAKGCRNLSGVAIPEGLESIGSGAFEGCTSISSLRLNSVIGSYAFRGCTSLNSVELGGACTHVYSQAFQNCTGLTELTIPDSVIILGNGFIQGCVNLRTLSINARTALTAEKINIGEGALLETVVLGNRITGLGDRTFANETYGYKHLTSVQLPMSVTSFGAGMFAGSAITNLALYMPASSLSGMVSYASGAFSGMDSLQTLTVLGGRIPSYAFAGNESLHTVVVKGGAVGGYAFSGCTGLTSVTLEEGVTSIGSFAFQNCTGLTSLVIPDSVTSYGAGMISGCTNITYLKIGGGVAELDAGDYSYDSSQIKNPFYIGEGSKLQTLVLGEGITSLGLYLFTNTRHRNRATNYTHYFGQLSTVELPSTLTSIGTGVFDGAKLTELVLAPGLAQSGYLFQGMTTLKKVTIQGGAVGSYAFSGCTGLTSVTLEEGVTSIGSFAFQNCTGLTSLVIPDSVTSYGAGMIYGCTNITYLKIGGGVAELDAGDYSYDSSQIKNPFYIGEGSKLQTLVLGEGITSLGQYVFTNTRHRYKHAAYTHYFGQLSTVELPSTLTSIGTGVFDGAKLTELVLAPGLAQSGYLFQGMTTLKKVTIQGGAVGSYAFSGCTGLTSVTLEEGVTSIGSFAFQNCTGLTSLVIPDSVTSYGAGMIYGCTNITYLKIGGGVAELDAGDYNNGSNQIVNPFYVGDGSKLQTLVLGEGITSLGQYLFTNTRHRYKHAAYTHYFGQLSTVELPSTLTSMETGVFDGAKLTELVLAPGLAQSGYLFQGMTTLKKVTIQGGAVGSYAFSGCTGLTSVTLEEGVTSIGSFAFQNCTGLTSLVIPDSVTRYGAGMISGCTNITYLKIGGGVAELDAGDYNNGSNQIVNPFYVGDGSKLQTLVLGEGITSLGQYLFTNTRHRYKHAAYTHYFGQLSTVELPSTLTSMETGVFDGAKLTELVLAPGLAQSGYLFQGMTTLKKVTIQGGAVGSYAFSGCTGLTSVTLEEGVTSIGSYAFQDCTGLTSLVIPDSVTSYGAGMIYGCTNITYLKIGGGVAELDAGDYNNGSNQIVNPFYVGDGSKLQTLVLGEGITSLGQYVFTNTRHRYKPAAYTHYFGQLRQVTLPSTLKSIATGNLSSWSSVTALHLPDGLETITDSAVPSWMTLYSTNYSEVIQSFSTAKGLAYIYDNKPAYPAFRLTCVAPAAGISSRGLTVSDGTLRATRGTEGEEALLPEGFAVLSEEEITFTDPVETYEPAVMDGYAFYGWYTDPEFTAPWNMASMPSADVTLYARIVPLVHVRYAVNLASAGSADEHLPAGFVLYQDFAVREYAELPVPSDPAPAGYIFYGWYMDAAFVEDYMPARVGTADMTFYGSLKKASAGGVYRLSNGSYTLTGYRLTEDESTEVHIPAKWNGIPVTAVGANAFVNSGVKTLYLPDTVTDIHEDAFRGSGISSVTVSKNNPVYATNSGVLYSKDRTRLISWPSGRGNAAFVIPATVTEIAEGAFKHNVKLKSVAFNDGLISIGASAFSGCTALGSVTLPDSVTTLGADAFAGCYGLASFTAYGLTDIGENAVPTGTGMKGYGPIGDNPLRRFFVYDSDEHGSLTVGYNEYLVRLYLDGTLKETAGGEAGMLLTSELKDVELENGSLILAWYRDSSMSEIWDLDTDLMPSEDLNLYAASTPAYEYETATVTAADGTEISGIRLTAYHGTGKELVIPSVYAGSPVIAIGSSFLSSGLKPLSVAVPASVVEIGAGAFGDAFSGTVICDADSYAAVWAEANGYDLDIYLYTLTLVQDEAHTTVYQLGRGVLQLLPEPSRTGYIFLGWFADEACTQPAELQDGSWRMGGSDITLYAGWQAEEALAGIPFTWEEADGAVTITGYTGTSDTLTVPGTILGLPVTAIGEEAFAGLGIRSIDLGAVTVIGASALADCSLLTDVTLPDSVITVGEYAFANCGALRTVHLGTSVANFPMNALQGCGQLRAITAAEGNAYYKTESGVLLTKDGSCLLRYPCRKTDAAYAVPEGVTMIGDGAFNGVRSLEALTVPGSVTDLGERAFLGCESLKSFTASNLLAIGPDAFFGCRALETVHPGPYLKSIGDFAFAACPALSEIILPECTVLDTGSVIFSGSESLVITGVCGSSANAYALAHGIPFSDPAVQEVTEIRISGERQILQRGETMQLLVTLTPVNAALGRDYTWQTTDYSVAFVDEENVLHAVGGGTATVTARTGNGLTAQYEIEVQVAVTELRITDYLAIPVGETVTPVITILPASATNTDLTWTSENPEVAVADEENRIIAVGVGITQLRAAAHNGLTAEITVDVYQPVESLSLTAPEVLFTLSGYETGTVAAVTEPADAADRGLSYTSDNPSAVAVDEHGVLTATGSGTAVITVTGRNLLGERIEETVEVTAWEVSSVLTLPGMLTEIEAEAFEGNAAVQGVILGERVAEIGSRAFADMNSLHMIVIPDSVTSIAEDAFDGSPVILVCGEDSPARTWAEEHDASWMAR